MNVWPSSKRILQPSACLVSCVFLFTSVFSAAPAIADGEDFKGACISQKSRSGGDIILGVAERDTAKEQQLLKFISATGGARQLTNWHLPYPSAVKTGQAFSSTPLGNYVRILEVLSHTGDCTVRTARTENIGLSLPLFTTHRITVDKQNAEGNFQSGTPGQVKSSGQAGQFIFSDPGVYKITVELVDGEMASAFQIPTKLSQVLNVTTANPPATRPVEMGITLPPGSKGGGTRIDGQITQRQSNLSLTSCQIQKVFEGTITTARVLTDTTRTSASGQKITGSIRTTDRKTRALRADEGLWELTDHKGTVLRTSQGRPNFSVKGEDVGDGFFRLKLSAIRQPNDPGVGNVKPAVKSISVFNCGAAKDPVIVERKKKGAAACKLGPPALPIVGAQNIQGFGNAPQNPPVAVPPGPATTGAAQVEAAINGENTPTGAECADEALELDPNIFDPPQFVNFEPDDQQGQANAVNDGVFPRIEQAAASDPSNALACMIGEDKASPPPVKGNIALPCPLLKKEIERRKIQQQKSCDAPLQLMNALIDAPQKVALIKQATDRAIVAEFSRIIPELATLAGQLRKLEAEQIALLKEGEKAGIFVRADERFKVQKRLNSPEEIQTFARTLIGDMSQVRRELDKVNDAIRRVEGPSDLFLRLRDEFLQANQALQALEQTNTNSTVPLDQLLAARDRRTTAQANFDRLKGSFHERTKDTAPLALKNRAKALEKQLITLQGDMRQLGAAASLINGQANQAQGKSGAKGFDAFNAQRQVPNIVPNDQGGKSIEILRERFPRDEVGASRLGHGLAPGEFIFASKADTPEGKVNAQRLIDLAQQFESRYQGILDRHDKARTQMLKKIEGINQKNDTLNSTLRNAHQVIQTIAKDIEPNKAKLRNMFNSGSHEHCLGQPPQFTGQSVSVQRANSADGLPGMKVKAPPIPGDPALVDASLFHPGPILAKKHLPKGFEHLFPLKVKKNGDQQLLDDRNNLQLALKLAQAETDQKVVNHAIAVGRVGQLLLGGEKFADLQGDTTFRKAQAEFAEQVGQAAAHIAQNPGVIVDGLYSQFDVLFEERAEGETGLLGLLDSAFNTSDTSNLSGQALNDALAGQIQEQRLFNKNIDIAEQQALAALVAVDLVGAGVGLTKLMQLLDNTGNTAAKQALEQALNKGAQQADQVADASQQANAAFREIDELQQAGKLTPDEAALARETLDQAKKDANCPIDEHEELTRLTQEKQQKLDEAVEQQRQADLIEEAKIQKRETQFGKQFDELFNNNPDVAIDLAKAIQNGTAFDTPQFVQRGLDKFVKKVDGEKLAKQVDPDGNDLAKKVDGGKNPKRLGKGAFADVFEHPDGKHVVKVLDSGLQKAQKAVGDSLFPELSPQALTSAELAAIQRSMAVELADQLHGTAVLDAAGLPHKRIVGVGSRKVTVNVLDDSGKIIQQVVDVPVIVAEKFQKGAVELKDAINTGLTSEQSAAVLRHLERTNKAKIVNSDPNGGNLVFEKVTTTLPDGKTVTRTELMPAEAAGVGKAKSVEAAREFNQEKFGFENRTPQFQVGDVKIGRDSIQVKGKPGVFEAVIGKNDFAGGLQKIQPGVRTAIENTTSQGRQQLVNQLQRNEAVRQLASEGDFLVEQAIKEKAATDALVKKLGEAKQSGELCKAPGSASDDLGSSGGDSGGDPLNLKGALENAGLPNDALRQVSDAVDSAGTPSPIAVSEDFFDQLRIGDNPGQAVPEGLDANLSLPENVSGVTSETGEVFFQAPGSSSFDIPQIDICPGPDDFPDPFSPDLDFSQRGPPAEAPTFSNRLTQWSQQFLAAVGTFLSPANAHAAENDGLFPALRFKNPQRFIQFQRDTYINETKKMEAEFLRRCPPAGQEEDENDKAFKNKLLQPLPPLGPPVVFNQDVARTSIGGKPEQGPAQLGDVIFEELQTLLDGVTPQTGFNPFDFSNDNFVTTFLANNVGGGNTGSSGNTSGSFSQNVACNNSGPNLLVFFNSATNQVTVDELASGGAITFSTLSLTASPQSFAISSQVLPDSGFTLDFNFTVDTTNSQVTTQSLNCQTPAGAPPTLAGGVSQTDSPSDNNYTFFFSCSGSSIVAGTSDVVLTMSSVDIGGGSVALDAQPFLGTGPNIGGIQGRAKLFVGGSSTSVTNVALTEDTPISLQATKVVSGTVMGIGAGATVDITRREFTGQIAGNRFGATAAGSCADVVDSCSIIVFSSLGDCQ